jgi:glycine/sarcosine N-methyltransferase
MMPEDLYRDFAERYDRFHGPLGEHDHTVVDFFRQLFSRHDVRRVLDCACGTGRDLHLFHSLGCDVLGTDISESMLAQATQNLTRAGLQVPLHRADYRGLPQHFDRSFDAVACLSSSILHMPNEAEVLRAFESMRQVLRDGGILVLTQGTTDKQWREKPRFILAVNDSDFTRLFVIDYLGQGARYNVLDIWHGESECDFKVWSVEYPLVLLQADQERLLEGAGFADIECYGGYNFEPYDPEASERLIAVARN